MNFFSVYDIIFNCILSVFKILFAKRLLSYAFPGYLIMLCDRGYRNIKNWIGLT
ncbi:unknown protein [Parachlamydia acanthamoebae UV-7]|uniref:Uncharacterized protein n=2 Tax=Parachlamydia acanthamoebae TaxID=83552 RepID=F8L1V6_PARAV|nr:hypothetical protein DB43_GW00170 [Parachlamydia acanthamoebae]CCB87270.1 unknown protein [Parachlamydia acanthamoebae UV-7]